MLKIKQRKIRLRLHGTRLPPNYTITLRLSTEDDNAARSRATPRKRRRRTAPSTASTPSTSPCPSPSPPPEGRPREASIETLPNDPNDDDDSASASDDEAIDEQTRLTNAYPGATNSIGSIHQRRWFITLDRANSGFEARRQPGDRQKTWVRKQAHDGRRLLGFEPFYVRGPEVERSVVTGRTGYEVLRDEGVEGFVPRRGWRAVLD